MTPIFLACGHTVKNVPTCPGTQIALIKAKGNKIMDPMTNTTTQSFANQRKLSNEFPTEIPNEVVESQTVKIPNLLFMGLAGASIVASIITAVKKREETDLANFVGQWAPTFLLLGIYNKIVKVEAELIGLQKPRLH